MDADAAAIAAATASVFHQQPSTSSIHVESHNDELDHIIDLPSDDTNSLSNEITMGEIMQSSATTQEQIQLRRQMVSVGKQPKAVPGRKKRDMVFFNNLNNKIKIIRAFLVFNTFFH